MAVLVRQHVRRRRPCVGHGRPQSGRGVVDAGRVVAGVVVTGFMDGELGAVVMATGVRVDGFTAVDGGFTAV